jgi:hypothetical protein
MIMVVNAAPRMVPATPNFEVTNAAVVEASPAANTWLPLTTGVLCASALFTNPTLSMTPPDYKGLQRKPPRQKRGDFDVSIDDLLDRPVVLLSSHF